MEHGSIEREIHVEASPEVVFDVITSPDHIREWWHGAETDLAPDPGRTCEIVWGDRESPDSHVARLTVVEAVAPRLFSFRWDYAEGEIPSAGNSLLVTFELAPSGTGTRLTLVETGFRERGWEVAKLEGVYADHNGGWDACVSGLGSHLATLATTP